MSTTNNKKEQLVAFLVKELGSGEAVKDFAQQLRALHIADVSNIYDIEKLTEDESARLFSLVTHYQFGTMRKLVEIQKHIKEL